jgi:hypothetical protein
MRNLMTNNNGHKINVEEFKEKLSHVVLYRIEVPEGYGLEPLFRNHEYPWRAT